MTRRLVDREVLALLPREFVLQHRVVPMFQVDGVLTLAVDDPTNLWAIDEVARLCRCEVQLVVTETGCIHALLEDLAEDGGGSFEIDDFVGDVTEGDVQVIEEKGDDAVNLH